MDIKGNLRVNSIATIGRRANEGLNSLGLTADYSLNKYASKYQVFTATDEYTVSLPDATTLDIGWAVTICNSGDSLSRFNIADSSGTILKNLQIGKTATYVLVAKLNAAGSWKSLYGDGSDAGGGASDGNVVLYASNGVIGVESASTYVTQFTVAAKRTRDNSEVTDYSALAYTLSQSIPGEDDTTIYEWEVLNTYGIYVQAPKLYSLTRSPSSFAIYSNQACTSSADVSLTYTAGTRGYTMLVYASGGATVSSTGSFNGFFINPFVASVLKGVNTDGETKEEIVYHEGYKAVQTQSNVSYYYYIREDGAIVAEESRQYGGDELPTAPGTHQKIFFLKPARQNYKYVDGAWTEYNATALCEAHWDAGGVCQYWAYPLNEWWWDKKYGDARNVLVRSTGNVITRQSSTSFAIVGNFVGTCAYGYDSYGKPIDKVVYYGKNQTIPSSIITSGSYNTIYYHPESDLLVTGSSRPFGGPTLPTGTTGYKPKPEGLYVVGDIFYSEADGKSYMVDENSQWVEYNCIPVAYIDESGNVGAFAFNTPAYTASVVHASQSFLNTSSATSSVVLSTKVSDPETITVNVSNTVLQTDNYSIGADGQTITFATPIPAGIKIEVRWTTPLDAIVVPQTFTSEVTVSDFNLFDSATLYSVVSTTQGVTQNPPLDITAQWFVQYIHYGTYKMMEATRIGDPSCRLVRTFDGTNWSNWVFVHASYYSGT